MSRTRIAVLGLAIGAAVVAAVLAKGVLNKQPEKQVVEINKVEQSEILVVSQDVKMGERLNSGNLAWQNWPKTNVKPYMITRADKPSALEDLENGRARVNLFEGDPLSDRKVIMPNTAGFMAALIGKGMRAVAVKIKADTAASGFILPNDRVDVLVTTKSNSESSGSSRNISEPVLTNVRVLAIDQTFQTNDKGEQTVVGETATLELDPRQAEVLTMAESNGQLNLLLRSLADRGDSALGDDGPRLADRFAKGERSGEITVYRFGIPSSARIQ